MAFDYLLVVDFQVGSWDRLGGGGLCLEGRGADPGRGFPAFAGLGAQGRKAVRCGVKNGRAVARLCCV